MSRDKGCVHVIDDDASWRVSVERLLAAVGYRVVLHDSAEGFLSSADLEAADCILLDMRMPGLTGLQLQQHVVQFRHKLPIVFISGHGDIPTSVQAMKAGAETFLTKPVDTDVLLGTIEEAIAHGRDDRDRREQVDRLRARFDTLTPTEREVFAKVVRGRLNKQVADDLDVAERTVKWHRQHIMQKLQVRSLAELVSLAERLGLVGDRASPAEPR